MNRVQNFFALERKKSSRIIQSARKPSFSKWHRARRKRVKTYKTPLLTKLAIKVIEKHQPDIRDVLHSEMLETVDQARWIEDKHDGSIIKLHEMTADGIHFRFYCDTSPMLQSAITVKMSSERRTWEIKPGRITIADLPEAKRSSLLAMQKGTLGSAGIMDFDDWRNVQFEQVMADFTIDAETGKLRNLITLIVLAFGNDEIINSDDYHEDAWDPDFF